MAEGNGCPGVSADGRGSFLCVTGVTFRGGISKLREFHLLIIYDCKVNIKIGIRTICACKK